MNKILSFLLLFTTIIFAQTPCVGGFAGSYPCNEIDLMSHIPLSTFGARAGNDSWGWTDPDTGKEYVIFGNTHNAAFIDISDPVNPIYLGKIDSHNSSGGSFYAKWRDIKVYNNYAFIVSEVDGHGIQIFDLTHLRNVTNPPVTFTEDAHFDGFGSAHNIVINEETGYAFGVGANTYSGGPHFVNILDPLNPIDAGGFSSEGYSHDAQVIIYNGPDTEHVGKEIYIGANEDFIVIVDVSDKSNPLTISKMTYSNSVQGYTHQVWLDENHTYLYCNDELDEIYSLVSNTRNIVFDLTDLDNPTLKHEYFGATGAVDHNNYVKGDKLYLANYAAGLRIIDISDIANQNMEEVAFFDSYPANNGVNFYGAWNVYPFFESGYIVISDINKGLFIVRDSNSPLATNNNELATTTLFPNPATNKLTITTSQSIINKIEVFDILGKNVIAINNINDVSRYELNLESIQAGFYFIKINEATAKKFLKK